MPRASAVTKLRSSAQPLPAGTSAGTGRCAASGGGVGMVVVRFMGSGPDRPIRLQQTRLPEGRYVGKACAIETVFMETVRVPAAFLRPRLPGPICASSARNQALDAAARQSAESRISYPVRPLISPDFAFRPR
ncbi:hypothetical protein CBM2592_B140075 [Cupriavidus taiwanensis]|nr:hypothetical protein CBM2588_B180076 [Cupriavidus taiwanensis]SOY66721.1 hypothetical protein CBM2592_B140075 [Cupriavidus taiwanensis]SOY94750.1 hypothetical protein CBM2591_B130076 [Cupriavidus taiwanensis]SOZ28098.1 hypothetical protein CBM2608_B130256 [Cupriavidus taiwanensis]SOZ71520.1 hypothetical protein CBM2617_B170075 [Cupriavidus taiwanensis]